MPAFSSLRRLGVAFAAALVFSLTLGLASAQADSDAFRLSSPRYSVSEGAGRAVITVTRSDATYGGVVRYIATHKSADPYFDYAPVKNALEFEAGQYSATFTVPIVDDSAVEQPETILLTLFGPADYGPGLGTLADPDQALLTIVDNDAIATMRNNLNPLDLQPIGGNPLSGARFFVDHEWGLAARFVHRYPALRTIADQPETKRFGAWDHNAGLNVHRYLASAEATDPGSIPLIAVYRLKHVRCGNQSESRREVASYKRWMAGFARAIGNYRAVLFLEPDALITTVCLSHRGLRARLSQLRYAIDRFSRLPHLVTYLDAGAADAISAGRTARLLRMANVRKIQGFFLNSTHFDWTRKEIAYGNRVSRATGGKHFVVSTAVNGRGPLVPHNRVKYGNEVLCNPSGRGLGPKPTASTGFPRVDGFIWVGNPGRSGHPCHGSPPTGVFWPAYALGLVRRADFRVR